MDERIIMPGQLLLRRGEADMIGTKLDLVEIRGNDHKIGYYAKLDGNCSVIESVGCSQLDRIKKGKDGRLFMSVQDLHNAVEARLKGVLSSIDRFRNTGKYFT